MVFERSELAGLWEEGSYERRYQSSIPEVEKCHALASACPDAGWEDNPGRQKVGLAMDELPFEVFEHTADVGLQVYGRTLPELFIHAAEGMESLMVPLEQVEPRISREVEVEGDDLVSLLIAWLSRLIFLFDTEFLLFRQFEIERFSETQLKMKARAGGEPYDEQRHELSSAIKAVTRHQAEVVSTANGYRARIIFDI